MTSFATSNSEKTTLSSLLSALFLATFFSVTFFSGALFYNSLLRSSLLQLSSQELSQLSSSTLLFSNRKFSQFSTHALACRAQGAKPGRLFDPHSPGIKLIRKGFSSFNSWVGKTRNGKDLYVAWPDLANVLG